MFTVIKCNYEALPEAVKDPELLSDSLPDNGCGKEYASYLVIKHNDTVLTIKSDAMEREDATFYRDLAWIKQELETAYKLGYEDAEKEIKR